VRYFADIIVNVLSAQFSEHALEIVSAGVDQRADYGFDAHDQLYRAPVVLGGAMIDGGEASPVESVPADADGSPQPL
jgi:hypothetical protein